MKSKTLGQVVALLVDNKNAEEISILKKLILSKMEIGEVHVSEKYRLVIEKRSKKKLLIRALITQ